MSVSGRSPSEERGGSVRSRVGSPSERLARLASLKRSRTAERRKCIVEMLGASALPEGRAAMKALAISGVMSAKVDTPNPRSAEPAKRLMLEISRSWLWPPRTAVLPTRVTSSRHVEASASESALLGYAGRSPRTEPKEHG
jgi:hypothetical protein